MRSDIYAVAFVCAKDVLKVYVQHFVQLRSAIVNMFQCNQNINIEINKLATN